jgi:hypothetical protein
MTDEAKYPISIAHDRTPGIHVFEGEDARFYWHVVSENGKITAVGGESFTTAEHAWEGFVSTRRIVLGGTLLRDREKLRQLIFLVGGAATRPLLEDNPDYEFPSQRVQESIEQLLEIEYPELGEPAPDVASDAS